MSIRLRDNAYRRSAKVNINAMATIAGASHSKWFINDSNSGSRSNEPATSNFLENVQRSCVRQRLP